MSNEPQYLYLTTTGWRSGKAHEIEIWFVSYADRHYIVSEKRGRSHWVRNIQRNSDVSFRVGNETFEGTGRIIKAETETELAAAIAALMDTKYGWSNGLIVELRSEQKE